VSHYFEYFTIGVGDGEKGQEQSVVDEIEMS